MPELERDEDFEALLGFVKQTRGFDFTGYKRPSLMRRFRVRMQQLGIHDYAEYRNYLASDGDEFAALFDTILINVTEFFRDPASWEYVAEEIVPRILDAKADDDPVRVWSTGCATGEEAYTAAIVFAEALGFGYADRLKIYATDADDKALASARHGTYPVKALGSVPRGYREKYFEAGDSRVAVRADVRRVVIFGRHNVLEDPPISRVDLLVARNMLMYFSPDKQANALAEFHFALNERGFLFLGKSEVLLTRSNLFVPVDLKRRVFAPVPKSVAGLPPWMPERESARDRPGAEGATLVDAAVESSPVAQLTVDGGGRLLGANVQTRRLFGIAERDIGRAFSDLPVSYRPADLRAYIDDARKDSRPVHLREVEWQRADGDAQYFDVHLNPIVVPGGAPSGVAIAFVDVTRYRRLQDDLERTHHEVETAYEELQATTEELETTNEELQSTNEELETTNEELQSTNEELETMNEELQSTNEEMETMNDELLVRTDEFARTNSFLESVLGSLRMGVAVLDRELRIRAWNRGAYELWGVRRDDVVGEHLLNLDTSLPVGELRAPIRECVDSGEAEELSLVALDRRGREIACRIACTPLRDPRGETDGVILIMEATEAAA
jgi:two-component system, chemotaxis family, CheB/CheR fusion protein